MNKFCSLPTDLKNMLSLSPKSTCPLVDAGSTIEPMDGIAAQALTSDGCSHCGWIKKEGFGNRTWRRRYMVIHKGCIYYFADANSESSKGSFTLEGYRVLQAHDRAKHPWTLKLVNRDASKRTYYIAADSEPELKSWLIKTREEIEKYFGSGSGDSIGSNEERNVEEGPSHTIDDYDYPDVVPKGPPKMPLPPTPDQPVPKRSSSVKTPVAPPPKVRRSLTDPSPESLNCPPVPPPRGKAPDEFYETPRFELPVTDRPLTSAPKPMPRPRSEVNHDLNNEIDSDAPSLPPKPKCRGTNNDLKPNEYNDNNNNPPVSVQCTDVEGSKTFPRATKPKPPPRPVQEQKPFTNLKTPGTWANKKSAIPGFQIDTTELRTMLRNKPSPKKNTLPIEAEDDGSSDEMEKYLEFEPESKPHFGTPGNQESSGRGFNTKRPLTHDMSELYVIDAMLPDSARREDLDKTKAGQLLLSKNVLGAYMMCSSKTAATKQALAVLVETDKHNTYIIFRDEEGYHLDPSEPVRCRNIEELIKYYRKNSLPKISRTLTQPYQE